MEKNDEQPVNDPRQTYFSFLQQRIQAEEQAPAHKPHEHEHKHEPIDHRQMSL